MTESNPILNCPEVDPLTGTVIGQSREGRPLRAWRFGSGKRVSLIGGCHADEPVGPKTLRQLCHYLQALDDDHPWLDGVEWWIIPHANPDGEVRNASWQHRDAVAYDIVEYLRGTVREKPGDDIEFGFPYSFERERAPDPPGDHRPTSDLRPECAAMFDWWSSDDRPFQLHMTLHGMAFAAGAWFLVEPEWKDRIGHLKTACTNAARQLGYVLHDVERHGEKGFFRIERGFCTRPDSRYMIKHFMELGDDATARRFRPNSMAPIGSLGGDPLTLVSEMPLFITPGVGDDPGPPDPAALRWKERIDSWREVVERDPARVREEAERYGLVAMPVRDQQLLQVRLIEAGLVEVGANY